MSSVIVPAANSIATDIRWLAQSAAGVFAALGSQVRIGICTVGDLIERRFAEFADVPYQKALSRQEWEELWEMEAEH